MKFEHPCKIPGGLWKDGVIATRPMAEKPAKKSGSRDHHSKMLREEAAKICLNCTRANCSGTCALVEPGRYRKKGATG